MVHTSNWFKEKKPGQFRLVGGVSLFVFLFIFPICLMLGFVTSQAYSVWFIRLVKCKSNNGFDGCVILFCVKYDALFLHHAFTDCGTLLSDKIPKDPLVPNQGEIVETDHLIR